MSKLCNSVKAGVNLLTFLLVLLLAEPVVITLHMRCLFFLLFYLNS